MTFYISRHSIFLHKILFLHTRARLPFVRSFTLNNWQEVLLDFSLIYYLFSGLRLVMVSTKKFQLVLFIMYFIIWFFFRHQPMAAKFL